MMTSLPQYRLMFTLQSGSPAILTENNVLRAFLHFGDVSYLFYETGFTFGWVGRPPEGGQVGCGRAERGEAGGRAGRVGMGTSSTPRKHAKQSSSTPEIHVL